MTHTQKNLSKLVGILGIAMSFSFGCAGEPYYPNTFEVPEDFAAEFANKSVDGVVKSGTSVVIYEDYDAWFGEDRVENVLQLPPFNLVNGLDYQTLPTSEIQNGIPVGCTVAIITSNSKGSLLTANNVNNGNAQAALDAFVQSGGTLVVHAADNIPEPYGFRAPGMFGPPEENGNSNTLSVVAAPPHPFVTGPDGQMSTSDDGVDGAIQFTIPCCAHHGDLSYVLPGDATPVISGLGGRTVLGEYFHGNGRVLVSTISMEYGVEGLYGQRDRTIINHLWNALNGGIGEPDNDGDGVGANSDCDDDDDSVGKLLYQDDFEAGDNGFFNEPARLSSFPWDFSNHDARVTGPSQQALLGQAQTWSNVRVYATLASGGSHGGCGSCGPTETNRWRAGIVVRANADADQDEGFHGYRCALASNAETIVLPHDGPSTGQFLQLSEFMDSDEDWVESECNGGPNTTFDQLARSDYTDGYDFNGGQPVELVFTAFGESLHCEFNTGNSVISAQAYDGSIATGSIGMSTLNLLGQYDNVKVCEAFAAK